MEFPLEPDMSSVRQARAMVRDPLKRWGLEDLIPATELLVSELVTNAFKYAKGETLLRLILEPDSLVCEVHDTSPALPRVLQVDRDAESGRGLHVVSQLAARWGARRTHTGKVVWCSQLVPEEIGRGDAHRDGDRARFPTTSDVRHAPSGGPGRTARSNGPFDIKNLMLNGPLLRVSYSTVTLFARLRGLSMSRPSLAAAW